MAERPVFVSEKGKSLFTKKMIQFKYNSGFAVIQKRKNIECIHFEFKEKFPNKKILEVSSKSLDKIGIELSAFNLHITENKTIESVFQSSKVFEKGGPFKDISLFSSKEAKSDIRLKNSGNLLYFQFNGSKFGLEPKTFFYNWLYINTLCLHKDLINEVIQYDAFTDIEFNPKKSINCQAESVAIFVSLYRQNLVTMALKSKEDFLRIVYPSYSDNKVCIQKEISYQDFYK